jgi:hypothetical protein
MSDKLVIDHRPVGSHRLIPDAEVRRLRPDHYNLEALFDKTLSSELVSLDRSVELPTGVVALSCGC